MERHVTFQLLLTAIFILISIDHSTCLGQEFQGEVKASKLAEILSGLTSGGNSKHNESLVDNSQILRPSSQGVSGVIVPSSPSSTPERSEKGRSTAFSKRSKKSTAVGASPNYGYSPNEGTTKNPIAIYPQADRGNAEVLDYKATLDRLGKDLDRIERYLKEWGHASVSELVVIPDARQGNSSNGLFAIDNQTTYDTYSDNIRESVNARASVLKERVTQLRSSVDSGFDALTEGSDRLKMESNRLALENLHDDYEIDRISRDIERERALLLLKREKKLGEALDESVASGEPVDSSLFPDIPPIQLPTSNLPSSISGSSGYSGLAENLTPTDRESRFSETSLPFSGETFKGAGALVSSPISGISLSEEDIQTIASSTTVSGKVLNFMSDPVGLSDSHRAYIGLTQVSVSPGTRTRSGYFCEVQMGVEYARPSTVYKGEFVNSLDEGESFDYPAVFAAFPLARAQITESQYSSRDQYEIVTEAAAKMASAGRLLSANFLMNYAKRLQHDVASKNALPMVVPSSTGNTISYRFQPSLMALSDPAKKNSKPGWVMNPTSIPVMVVIIAERHELDFWDHLHLSVTTRWVPMSERHWANKVATDWWLFRQRPSKNFTNVERMDIAYELDRVRTNYDYRRIFAESERNVYSEIRGRYFSLADLVGSSSHYQIIPTPKPFILDVTPREFTSDDLKKGIVILGENFCDVEKGIGLRAYFNGIPLELEESKGKSVLAKLGGSYKGSLPESATASAIRVENLGGVSEPYPVSLTAVKKTTPSAPPASLPCLSSVQPQKGFLSQATYLAVSGERLKSARISQVNVGGRNCEFQVVGDKSMIVVVPPWSGDETSKLRGDVVGRISVVSEGGIATLDDQPISFTSGEADLFATLPPPALTKEQAELLRIAEAYQLVGELGRENGGTFSSTLKMKLGGPATEGVGSAIKDVETDARVTPSETANLEE